MLKNAYLSEKPDKEQLKARLKEQRLLLFKNQTRIRDSKLPVIVIVEGWGTAGKGTLIGNIINNIDPRFYKVSNFSDPTPDEKRYPMLKRYYEALPEQGKLRFCNSGWMSEITRGRIRGEISDKD